VYFFVEENYHIRTVLRSYFSSLHVCGSLKNRKMLSEKIPFIKPGSFDGQDYLRKIIQIEQSVKSDMKYEVVKQIIEEEICFNPIWLLKPFNKLTKYVYRARNSTTFDNEEKEIEFVSSFSIPPDSKTRRGRANIEKMAVKYCSLSSVSTLFETECKAGEVVYIGKWELPKRKNYLLGDFFFLDTDCHPLFKSHHEIAISHFKKQFHCESQENMNNIIKGICQKISWFLSEDDYSISSYFAHNYIYNFDLSSYKVEVDGIIFPSIAFDKRDINFAFSRNFSEEMICRKIYKMKIIVLNCEKYKVDLLKVGSISGKNVKWEEPNETTVEAFKEDFVWK